MSIPHSPLRTRTAVDAFRDLQKGIPLQPGDLDLLREAYSNNPRFSEIMRYAKHTNPNIITEDDPFYKKYLTQKQQLNDLFNSENFRPPGTPHNPNKYHPEPFSYQDYAAKIPQDIRGKKLNEVLGLENPSMRDTTIGRLPAYPPKTAPGFSFIQSDKNLKKYGWYPHGSKIRDLPAFDYGGDATIDQSQHGYSIGHNNPSILRPIKNDDIQGSFRELMSSQGINTKNIGRQDQLIQDGTPVAGEMPTDQRMGELNADFGNRIGANPIRRGIGPMPGGASTGGSAAQGSNPMTISNMPGAAGAARGTGLAGALAEGEGAAAAGGMGVMGGASMFASRAMPIIGLALMGAQLLQGSRANIDANRAQETHKSMRM